MIASWCLVFLGVHVCSSSGPFCEALIAPFVEGLVISCTHCAFGGAYVSFRRVSFQACLAYSGSRRGAYVCSVSFLHAYSAYVSLGSVEVASDRFCLVDDKSG
uniref:Putative secreted protein n=1 Tax=Ixodes ricinus TaxID=34613 RepID=A0A6B0UFI6_IXORI